MSRSQWGKGTAARRSKARDLVSLLAYWCTAHPAETIPSSSSSPPSILVVLSLTLLLVCLAEGGDSCRGKLLFSGQAVNILLVKNTAFASRALLCCCLLLTCSCAPRFDLWDSQSQDLLWKGSFFAWMEGARSHIAQTNVFQLFWREFTAPSYHKFCSLFAIAVQEWREKKVELDLSHSDK